MEMFRFRAMNTDVILAAEGPAEGLSAGFDKVKNFIDTEECRFTRFSTSSELAHMNQSAGSWFKLSPEMLEVVQLAIQYRDQTGGLFDPSILHDLERVGYDRSMDYIRMGQVSPLNSANPRPTTNHAEIHLRSQPASISLPPGTGLDLGGIAKGWIVERAARLLSNNSPNCAVSAGGDMFTIGLPEGETAWDVAIEDPRNLGEPLANLKLTAGAVATSTITRRAWKQGEILRHHLIDPRTGEPAETDWLSVTVIAADLSLCEVYAKALLIAGSKEAREVAKNVEIAYIAVDREGQILGNEKSLEYLHE